jgi:hypothetical protein
MTARTALKHQFVSSVPENLDDGILYVSMQYRTAIHKCFCGCGHEVATPLSPTDWKLTFDGVSISLYPSVGNWSLACQSHYWIDRNAIEWAGQWSEEQIAAGRRHDRASKDMYYGGAGSSQQSAPQPPPQSATTEAKRSVWSRLAGWLSR